MSNLYGEPGFNTTASGETYDDGLGIQDSQVLDHENGEHLAPNDILDYHNAGPRETVMTAEPHRFMNRKAVTFLAAKARSFNGVSSIALYLKNYLSGISFQETSGTAAAVVRLHDSVDMSGPVIMQINLAPNESSRDFFHLPIEVSHGLYIELVTGTASGNVYTVEERNV